MQENIRRNKDKFKLGLRRLLMINIIYKMKTDFESSPNELLLINQDYNFKNSFCGFGTLSKTNVFIGENNSGKSRFLRYLFETSFHSISEEQFDKFFTDTKSGVYGPYETIPKSNMKRFNDIYEKIGEERSGYSNVGNRFFKALKNVSRTNEVSDRFYFPVIRGTKDYKTIINNKLRTFLSSANSIQNKDSIYHYISLLNLEPQGLESFDIYNDIISHEYFRDNKSFNSTILTGGKLYQEIKSMLLGEENQRKLIEDFQKFLQENFFSDYDKVQLIPNEKKKVLCVKIGKDERAIYDWGDGTQQLIIILYSLFKHKDEQNKLFFIEEPEMYLHPGILRKFIEVINTDLFKNHQYFITTHSNIVLDTSADTNINMSIFKFKKMKDKSKNRDKDFSIEQCNNGDTSLLNELGVRNSSLFLSNCSIWVEGITDRLYLKHYLKLYCNKHKDKKVYRENIDYTFIEYGGGNVVHFNFDQVDKIDSINAKYINNKIFLIADNDNSKAGSAKALRKERYREQLKDNFYELPVVEIENLITFDTLRSVLVEQNPNKKDQLNEVLKKEKDFSKKKLGRFIDSLFLNEGIKKYASESGAIKDKLSFCKSIVEIVDDYDKLSEEAKNLIEKIYLFIEKNNEM